MAGPMIGTSRTNRDMSRNVPPPGHGTNRDTPKGVVSRMSRCPCPDGVAADLSREPQAGPPGGGPAGPGTGSGLLPRVQHSRAVFSN